MSTIDIESILREVLREYALPWYGDHGLAHWGRVLENGVRLAATTGADLDVVALFAILHDARRVNEHHDPGHGRRGADLARSLRGECFELDDERFSLLVEACSLHTDGQTEGPVTVRTCWDADRLDLGRIGVVPWPERLCTDAGRDPAMIEWAHRRATEGVIAEVVLSLWDGLANNPPQA
ncbi:MAG: HD domain-containing protein [Planctomycetes bacterium]|nr:HD domain-containing protein [Planctomycetota bacterium]